MRNEGENRLSFAYGLTYGIRFSYIHIQGRGERRVERRSEVWYGIWQEKYETEKPRETESLIHSRDGFDSLSAGQWEKLAGYYLEKLSVTDHDDVVEIGCGAGAFLEHISRFRSLSGVDYSAHAIRLIRERFDGVFAVAEANSLPFKDCSFDLAISWSVFFYFDSLDYASSALEEMRRVTRDEGRIFVGDLNDLGKKELAVRLRSEGRSAREKNYVSGEKVDQLYFPKDFFRSWASRHGMEITFFDEDTEDLSFYPNSRYRYSLIMKRS